MNTPKLMSVVALSIALSAGMVSCGSSGDSVSARSNCKSNMKFLDVVILTYCTSHEESPPGSFSDLNEAMLAPEAFFCPGAVRGKKPKSISDAAADSDYIYITGYGMTRAETATNAIIICPPENHADAGGTALIQDHTYRWFEKADIDRMIEAAYANDKLTIVVGPDLEKRSGGKYFSKKPKTRKKPEAAKKVQKKDKSE